MACRTPLMDAIRDKTLPVGCVKRTEHIRKLVKSGFVFGLMAELTPALATVVTVAVAGMLELRDMMGLTALHHAAVVGDDDVIQVRLLSA